MAWVIRSYEQQVLSGAGVAEYQLNSSVCSWIAIRIALRGIGGGEPRSRWKSRFPEFSVSYNGLIGRLITKGTSSDHCYIMRAAAVAVARSLK